MISTDLTPRQREIVAMLPAPNRQIAAALNLSEGAVKQYISRALERTGMPNRTAMAMAWRDRTA
jgi:DNA-binding NarL/FixJ family response regulator